MGTRTRTRGGNFQIAGVWYAGAANAQNPYNYYATNTRSETITDESTPNFAALRDNGAIINKPCTITKRDLIWNQATVHWTRLSDGWHEGGTIPSNNLVGYPSHEDVLTDTLASAAAVNSAHAGVSSSYASVAVTLAEIDQTCDMVRNLGRTANGVYNAMVVAMRSVRGRRNSVRAQKDAAKAISDAWLTARYGMLPAVYDVQGVMKALKAPPYPPRETSRGRVVVSDSGKGTGTLAYVSTIASDWTFKRTTTYRAGVLYASKMDLGAMYSSRLGLSFADALTVPWDLVPLSFVLDWAIDIGDWLRAITPKPGVDVLATWLTTKSVNEFVGGPLYCKVPSAAWTTTCQDGGLSDVKSVYTRAAQANPTIPGYGTGLTLNRSIDAAMLAFNRLKLLDKFVRS